MICQFASETFKELHYLIAYKPSRNESTIFTSTCTNILLSSWTEGWKLMAMVKSHSLILSAPGCTMLS